MGKNNPVIVIQERLKYSMSPFSLFHTETACYQITAGTDRVWERAGKPTVWDQQFWNT